MSDPKWVAGPNTGYEASFDMGADGKFTITLVRMHTQSGRPIPELVLRHQGVEGGKVAETQIAFDYDTARIYAAFFVDALNALEAERARPSAPTFLPPADPKRGGRS